MTKKYEDDDDDIGLSCSSCPYCDEIYEQCRRYAPRFVKENMIRANFPGVDTDSDWCGEHPDFKSTDRQEDLLNGTSNKSNKN